MANGSSLTVPDKALNTRRWPHSLVSLKGDSEHAQAGKLRSGAVKPFRQLRQVAGWHRRKEMVLHVKEHVVRGAVLQHAAQRPGKWPVGFTVVMDRPNGKE